MHILELAYVFPPYGGGFCIEQARALKARGHEVRILSCVQLGMKIEPWTFLTARLGRWTEMVPKDNEVEDGLQVEAYRTFYHGLPLSIHFNQKRWCSIMVSMYNDYKKKYGKPDVLHAHGCQWTGVAAKMISEKEDIPYYITEHTSSILYDEVYGEGWQRELWGKELIRNAYKNAECVIPVAEELVDNLAPLFGKDYKYKAISNIIDTKFFSFREREPLKGRPFRFCCLARGDVYGKGFDVLSQVMKELPDIELHIAGKETESIEMQQLFKGMKNVTFHGTLDKEGVRSLLYRCDALVLASRCEAQPLVLLEAMATGIPVVSTECTPKIERVDDYCLIAKIGDVETLKEAMQKATLIVPSQQLSEKIKSIASPESVATQIEEVFK